MEGANNTRVSGTSNNVSSIDKALEEIKDKI